VAGFSSGGAGIVADPSYRNLWERNHYRRIRLAAPFRTAGKVDWRGWQNLGQDKGGTFE
jgi:hypothetical protein